MQDKNAKCRKKRGRPSGDLTPNTILAKKLQSLLGTSDFTSIGEKMSVGRDAAKKYLVGERTPDSIVFNSLVEQTGVDLNWLLNDKDSTPEKKWPVFSESKNKKNPPANTEGEIFNPEQREALAACTDWIRCLLVLQQRMMERPELAPKALEIIHRAGLTPESVPSELKASS